MSEIESYLNKIHQKDCIQLMKEMPEESVSTIVTSPPYNLKNTSGGGVAGGRGCGKWPNAALADGYENYDDNMPHDKYVEWQRACLTNMMRILKNDGAIFYNHKWRVQRGLIQDRQDIVEGFPVRQIIIWKRKGGINFNDGYFLPTYEVIYLIAKPDFKLAPKANAHGDVWEITQTKGIDHPAPFPLELAHRCISSTKGGIVFDPFMGSGTTAVAATELGREWIGCELSESYCKLAEERLHNFSK